EAPMKEAQFWRLIENNSPCADGAKQLVKVLIMQSERSVRAFHERLARLLWNLDGPEHANRGSSTAGSYISPDRFVYQRSWVVGQGRATYYGVLNDPRRMPTDEECEALISAAPRALGLKMEIEEEEAYIPTSVSFESFSNWNRWRTQE